MPDEQTTVRRVRSFDPVPTDESPWVADVRTFDVPETIAACIRNAAPGLIAITLSRRGGTKMIAAAAQAAAERGVRILWWTGPGADDVAKLEKSLDETGAL